MQELLQLRERGEKKERRDLNARPCWEQEKERTANRIRILNDLKEEEKKRWNKKERREKGERL